VGTVLNHQATGESTMSERTKSMSVKLQRALASRVRYALDTAACMFDASVRGHIEAALSECDNG
jgi:hypothetical protein